MKIFSAVFLVVLPAFCLPCLAQGGVTKPVLQAAPAPQPQTAIQPAAPAQAVPVHSAQAEGVSSETPPDPAASSSSYIITQGDTLGIAVWKEPGMSTPSIPVRPDGMVSLSLLGDLPAAGITPMHLSTDIATRLRKYINDPRVTVTVVGVQPKEVYILGEIQHVGPVVLTPEMTPLQAISAAGGLSPFAKAKNIYILRKEAGKQRKIPFNYKKAIKDGDLQGVALLPGDTILVP